MRSLLLFRFSKSLFPSFSDLKSFESASIANMKTFKSSGGRKNPSRSLLTRLLDTSRSKEFDEKLQISLLSMKELLKRVVEADTASSLQVGAELKAKTENKRSQKFVTSYVATDDFLLGRAGTEQDRQASKAFTAVQTYAAHDARVSQWFSIRFRNKELSTLFLDGRTFLKSVLEQKKAAAWSSPPQSFSTTTEALLYFYGTEYVNGCLHDR